jgi:hypothetical protein
METRWPGAPFWRRRHRARLDALVASQTRSQTSVIGAPPILTVTRE